MSESGKPDRWNSLLETLGVPASEKPAAPVAQGPEAEAPPPAPAKTQPISMLRPEKPKSAPKPKAASPAAKSPSYWSRIAGALGLETPASPEPPAAQPTKEEPTPPAAEEPRHARTERAHETRRPHRPDREHDFPPRAFERPAPEERPRGEERVRGGEGPPRASEPAQRSPLDEMFGMKQADVDVFGLGGESESPRLRESSKPRSEEEERGSVLDYDVPEGAGSDLSLGEEPAREFGAAGEERAEREGRRRRRRRRGRGRRGSGEGQEAAAPRHEADIEPAGEEADFDVDRDEELDLEAELPEERNVGRELGERGARYERGDESDRYPSRGERAPREEADERGGRRRRRRGGGREREEGAAARPSAYRGEDDDRERFGPPRGERPASARVPHEADEEIDDELQGIADEGDEGRGGDVPTHKKIPTWDEAIGILIEANMASRANSPDRDRGRGRGRGRR